MNGYEFAFYSICVICGTALIALAWCLAANSEPEEDKYQKYVDMYLNRAVWYKNESKPEEKDNEQ